MHMLSRNDLNLAELETVRVSRTPTKVITANGEVQTNEEATENVHDLELFVTVQILEDTHAVLSPRKLCEEHGYSYDWASGQKPQLTQNGKRILCNTENFAPIVVPGLSTGASSSTASTSSTSLLQGTSDDSSSSPPTTQHQSKIGTRSGIVETGCETCQSGYRSSQKIWKTKECWHQGTHAQTLLRIQTREVLQKMWDLQQNQNYKGSLQGAHWRFRSGTESQSSQWRMWISKRSPMRSRGARIGHSMDTYLTCAKPKLFRRRKGVYEHFSNRPKSQKSLIRDKCNCWENSTQNL